MVYYEFIKVIIDIIIYYYDFFNFIIIDKKLLFTSKFGFLLYYFLNIKKKLFIAFYL